MAKCLKLDELNILKRRNSLETLTLMDSFQQNALQFNRTLRGDLITVFLYLKGALQGIWRGTFHKGM